MLVKMLVDMLVLMLVKMLVKMLLWMLVEVMLEVEILGCGVVLDAGGDVGVDACVDAGGVGDKW
jgi:hypothetical protein